MREGGGGRSKRGWMGEEEGGVRGSGRREERGEEWEYYSNSNVLQQTVLRSYEIVRRPNHTQKHKVVSGPVPLPAAHLVVLLLDVVTAGSSPVRLTHLLRTHSVKVHLLHKNRQGRFS